MESEALQIDAEFAKELLKGLIGLGFTPAHVLIGVLIIAVAWRGPAIIKALSDWDSARLKHLKGLEKIRRRTQFSQDEAARRVLKKTTDRSSVSKSRRDG